MMLSNGKIAVHFRGPLRSRSGYGVSSRQIVDYLLTDSRFQVFVEDVGWGATPSVHQYDFKDENKLKVYYELIKEYEVAKTQNIQFDISIQCTIASEFERRAQLNIGVTAGIEVDRCSYEWIKRSNQMDFIVVPSEFSKNILEQTSYQLRDNRNGQVFDDRINKPIVVIPHWFDKPEEVKPLNLSFMTKKNLLFVGLWGNKGGFGEDRKNIADLVRLFYANFGDDADCGLILKTSTINNSPEDLFHTKKKLDQIKSNFPNAKAKVYLLHEYLTEDEMWALYKHPSILGYVSISHGEGFGLPVLEAAASGLPVLGVNFSGYLDFCRPKHGFIPFDYSMVEIPECQVWENVIDKGSRWAKVDDEDFQKRVKKFLSSPKPIQAQAKENVKWLEDNFSKSVVLEKWKAFFDSFVKVKKDIQELNLERDEDRQIANAMMHREKILDEAEILRKEYGISLKGEKKKALYVMPQSFGDSVISTAIVDSLLKARHAEDEFYVATSEVYMEVYAALEKEGVKLIKYSDKLLHAELTREVWDYVYTPGVNVQYQFSNWTLGNGDYGLGLLSEFAKNCNLHPSEITDYKLAPKECWVPEKPFITITPVTSKQSKSYKYWDDVIANIKRMGDIEVVQLGAKNEKLYNGCIDLRGISYNETMHVVSKSVLHVAPDTGTAHVAGALKVPHIVLFASTSPNQCAPTIFDKDTKQITVLSNKICDGGFCYKDVCASTKDGKNCLSEISPNTICQLIYKTLTEIEENEKE